jgi:virginiamycin B lyase
MPARIASKFLLIAVFLCTTLSNAFAETVHYFPVPKGTHPHDVAASPEANGVVYYTAQHTGKLGLLYPASGKTEEFPLGEGSAPHGVIIGPDKAPWITDGGLNAIVRFDPRSRSVKTWPLPKDAADANLNTASFDKKGRLWFTGQNGFYGRLDPATGDMKVWKSPRGRGPYGITTTPAGEVFYASLAGNHIARIDTESGEATVIEPPTKEQGARRVWSDSKGNLWVSYWNTGHVGKYNPATRTWHEWKMAGDPKMYAVWVDEQDKVWLTDFESNAIVRFDPATDRFKRFPSNQKDARVRQLLGRPGEVWGAESGNDRLVRIMVK